MLYKQYLGQQQFQPCLLLFASCWLLLKGDCQHTYNVIGNNLILLARLSFVSWKKEKWSHSDVFLQPPSAVSLVAFKQQGWWGDVRKKFLSYIHQWHLYQWQFPKKHNNHHLQPIYPPCTYPWKQTQARLAVGNPAPYSSKKCYKSTTTGIIHGKKLRISEQIDESQRRVLKH